MNTDKPTTTASAPETRTGKGSYLADGRRTIPAKWRTIPAEKPTAVTPEGLREDRLIVIAKGYKAHAAQLAEALQEIANSDRLSVAVIQHLASNALAAYEEGK